MQRLTLVTGALLSFGAGFISGHYSAVGSAVEAEADRLLSSPGVADSSEAAAKGVGLSGMPARAAWPVQGGGPGALAESAATGHPGPPHSQPWIAPARLPPPPQLVLTPQELADLVDQQWEARQASIRQAETLIQSLEHSGAPEEDIAHFRELKMGLEEQPGADAESLDNNPPERTEEELRNDLAASLEQSGMLGSEHQQVIESLSAAPTSVDEAADGDGPSSELAPPQGPVQ